MPSTRPRWPTTAGARAAEDWSDTAAVATWDGRYLHLWGWDGHHTAPTNWLYRGFRVAPWPGSPLGHGQLGSIDVALSSVERVRPVTARLDPVRGADWLLGIDVGEPSAVDAAHARSVERGLRIVYAIRDEPWGVRRFFVEDPGGTIINVLAHLP